MISDRVYVMYAGEVIEEAVTQTLFSESYHPYTKGLLSSIPKLNGQMGDGIDGKYRISSIHLRAVVFMIAVPCEWTNVMKCHQH